MITTVNVELTYDGKQAKALFNQSEKKIKSLLKELTGATDVDIIEVESWYEEGDDGWVE